MVRESLPSKGWVSGFCRINIQHSQLLHLSSCHISPQITVGLTCRIWNSKTDLKIARGRRTCAPRQTTFRQI